MEGSWVAIAVLLAIGGGLGCLVYELLVRSCAEQMVGPPTHEGISRPGEARGGLRPREESGGRRRLRPLLRRNALRGRRDRERAGDAATSRMLVAATMRVEGLLPMTRADGDAYRIMIARAGWNLEPETWRALRVLSAAGCGALACLLSLALGSVAWGAACVSVGVASVAGWWMPRLALARAQTRRRRAIEAQLPDAMELLGIAIAAGSPVEQCFREVAQNLKPPLSKEFEGVDREVNLLGHSREQALDHLAKRCASRDVSAFVAQLAQAVSQGSSIAEGLSSQAALARETAQAAALERIRKMPTKLDVILSFCFLPPTIALVVVPTVVDLLKFLNDTLQ